MAEQSHEATVLANITQDKRATQLRTVNPRIRGVLLTLVTDVWGLMMQQEMIKRGRWYARGKEAKVRGAEGTGGIEWGDRGKRWRIGSARSCKTLLPWKFWFRR